jgi:hypothetical protein
MRGGEISKDVNEPSVPNEGVQNLRKELDWKEAFRFARAQKQAGTPDFYLPVGEGAKLTDKEIDRTRREAREAFDKGYFETAELRARQLVEVYDQPSRFSDYPLEEAQTLLARAMSKQRKYAGPEFDKAIELSARPFAFRSEDGRDTVHTGQLLFEKGVNALTCKGRPDAKEAKKALEEAILKLTAEHNGERKKRADNLLPDVYEHRAIAKARLGDIDGALLDLEQAKDLRKRTMPPKKDGP